ncbi:uncharacterized protein DNG_10377 [Cephalotrichum gorgonifer]|uniref:Inner kinetochore subunit AME1 domain-containing protein n=1 Tax=Cephalotrichum gorgonifer TaxID=2041049 RepID=A0AAE8T0M4_9PEZI|nr:uncharacterized protein DNG_10377 [Cephalotrichum gorgonifer]
MATREERMRQRLRGAVRHQVEDISFGLFVPEIEPDNEEGATEAQTAPEQTTPDTAKSTSPKSLRTASDRRPSSAAGTTPRSTRIRPGPYEVSVEEQGLHSGDAGEDDILAFLPPQATGRRSTGTRRSLGSSDVVQESPVNAPGSGRRVSTDTRGMRNSSQRLQRMLQSVDGDEERVPSSPLARKSRQSGAAAVAQTTAEHTPRTFRLSRAVVPDDGDEVDELSPNAPKTGGQDEDGAEEVDDAEATRMLGGERPRRSTARMSPSASKTVPRDEDGAEEIDDAEAARVLGRKRPRRSTARISSPVLGSQEEADESPREASVSEAVEAAESPAEEAPPKRQRRRPQPSPSTQKQPAKKQRAPHRKKREKTAEALPDDTSADEMGNNDAAVIPITVQRFKKSQKRHADGPDTDILAASIPFSNQKGVNVVDVLAQSSEEVIGACIEQLVNALQNVEASSARKELRVKIKALEAYREEVRTRLLTHTIMLDNLYSLRQRVREAEITRNKLRDSIMQHREEQEQLHIRMDAERDAHDESRKFLASRMDMSTSLHAIRQAVEQGKAGDEKLNPSEVLKANLAMLEVDVPDLASKVCRTSDRGGLMQQVLRFNGFLERAATELERRQRTSGSRLLA